MLKTILKPLLIVVIILLLALFGSYVTNTPTKPAKPTSPTNPAKPEQPKRPKIRILTVALAICALVYTLASGVLTNIISKYVVDPYFPGPGKASPPVSSTNINTSDVNASGEDVDIVYNDHATEEDKMVIKDSSEGDYSTSFKDISGLSKVSGSIIDEKQTDSYKYTARVSGIYRFYSDISSGGSVRIRICGENGDSIYSGSDALSINLEQGKTYILSVEYRTGPCDYTVNIGVPILMIDVSDKTSIVGKITYQDQSDKYYYTAPTSGTYRFDADLSAGGGVRVRISGVNGDSIKSGNDALSIDLEQGKTYILSVEYRTGPCEYTVNIGVPTSIIDISDNVSISGKITYQDQSDKYYYTAPTSGTYRFDTNLSAGGGVRIRISGENGNSLDYGNDALTYNLEAMKTYILSIEYRNGSCDYTVHIGVPIPITDISGRSFVSGNITYQDQKDRYYYTAPTSGTYRFDTNLSAGGGVRVRISGENGNSLDYGNDALTYNLEAMKTYILSIEYRTGVCEYNVSIGVPIPITDISGKSFVSGNITYQDQKDRYYYTASTSGTYRFDTNLSAGGGVRIRISGENGNSLDYGNNALTYNLEAKKTYILSVEYRNAPCSYELLVSIP